MAVQQQFLPDRLMNSGAVINVLPDGHVDVARPGTIADPRHRLATLLRAKPFAELHGRSAPTEP